MTTDAMLEIVSAFCAWAYTAWVMCWIARFLGVRSRRWINWVFFELRPIAPFFLLASYLLESVLRGNHGMGWRIFTLACGAYNWWASRGDKDDDDRWKKRRRKVAARVKQVGQRLAVVPAGASS